MKTKFLLMLALMLLTVACRQYTREEIVELAGQAQMKRIEKKVDSRIRKMVVNKLKYPESYQPISTDMSIVTSNMIIYDSQAFIALRDLNRAIENFYEEYGNDTTSQAARSELSAIQSIEAVVRDRDKAVGSRPVELVGIDAYHQFYAEDQPGHQVKKGYHFIVYRDNRITLLCDHDEYQQVVTFARQFLKASPYRTN